MPRASPHSQPCAHARAIAPIIQVSIAYVDGHEPTYVRRRRLWRRFQGLKLNGSVEALVALTVRGGSEVMEG